MALIIGHLAAVALVAGIALGASSCDDDGGNGGGTDPTPPSVVDGIWQGSFDEPVDGGRERTLPPIANASVLAVGSGQEIMPQDDSAIPVEFDMSLYSTSDVIVAGSYSDSSGRDGAADGNFLDPQLTVFARAVEGNLRFVGNINDGTLPYEWSRTVQAQTAAGTIMWTTPFTATKEVSWDDFAGEYP